MNLWMWLWLAIIAAISILSNYLPVTGFAWGGRHSDHPGWWWTRRETVYVKRIGEGDRG